MPHHWCGCLVGRPWSGDESNLRMRCRRGGRGIRARGSPNKPRPRTSPNRTPGTENRLSSFNGVKLGSKQESRRRRDTHQGAAPYNTEQRRAANRWPAFGSGAFTDDEAGLWTLDLGANGGACRGCTKLLTPAGPGELITKRDYRPKLLSQTCRLVNIWAAGTTGTLTQVPGVLLHHSLGRGTARRLRQGCCAFAASEA